MGLTSRILLAFALALAVEGLVTIDSANGSNYSFAVDYEQNQFLLDGRPFRYVSGSFHYFRAPRMYWRDRLRKLRAAGLNAVSTYVEWSLHEPLPGQWNWDGDADLEYFLTLAQEENLFVLLRPGPYICAERDFGGFPFWLLHAVPDVRLRTDDPRYMRYVTIYVDQVMRRVVPFLRGNGGPIIMVQVENEYGSYNACDLKYMSDLRDLFHRHIGNKALLYTTDGASNRMLRCGKVPQVYGTVDFGVGTNVTQAFATMRRFQPKGPFVNSEFYSGWLTHWEEPRYQKIDGNSVAKKLDEMLATGASINFYMFYGGTNFGLTSGANTDPNYRPQLTSYDYDAPITEAGDLTEKYFKIKTIIEKYLPIPNVTLPLPSQKGDYGFVLMEPVLPLFDPYARAVIGTSKLMQNTTPTFESFGIPLPLVLYETYLPSNYSDPSIINVGFIHDRALVYEDDRLVGTLSRTHDLTTVALSRPYSKRLNILVENQGHINYGNKIHDFKGIGNVTLNGHPFSNWNVTGFSLSGIHLHNLSNITNTRTVGILNNGPVLFQGTFTVAGIPLDTFLDTTGWGKGYAIINGWNLGRYWPVSGPQINLYVPASFLRTGKNDLVLLELEYVPETRKIKFQTVPK